MNIHGLDGMFSRLVRGQAHSRCVYCGGRFSFLELQCSHFHSRRLKSTRFDPENCEVMCARCHQYLDTHPLIHAEWKRRQLGEERFEALRQRPLKVMKPNLPAIRESITKMAAEYGVSA